MATGGADAQRREFRRIDQPTAHRCGDDWPIVDAGAPGVDRQLAAAELEIRLLQVPRVTGDPHAAAQGEGQLRLRCDAQPARQITRTADLHGEAQSRFAHRLGVREDALDTQLRPRRRDLEFDGRCQVAQHVGQCAATEREFQRLSKQHPAPTATQSLPTGQGKFQCFERDGERLTVGRVAMAQACVRRCQRKLQVIHQRAKRFATASESQFDLPESAFAIAGARQPPHQLVEREVLRCEAECQRRRRCRRIEVDATREGDAGQGRADWHPYAAGIGTQIELRVVNVDGQAAPPADVQVNADVERHEVAQGQHLPLLRGKLRSIVRRTLTAPVERAQVEAGDAERTAESRSGAAEGERELPGKLVRRGGFARFIAGISQREHCGGRAEIEARLTLARVERAAGVQPRAGRFEIERKRPLLRRFLDQTERPALGRESEWKLLADAATHRQAQCLVRPSARQQLVQIEGVLCRRACIVVIDGKPVQRNLPDLDLSR
ncbi:MAG: hypothetical protein AW07_04196 [Candidatus Accumulibacter sp. SK-11]|nr:MAG: hypothetical protein AW07_04196 [Candidatus Accumulibacter sp. SK-11]